MSGLEFDLATGGYVASARTGWQRRLPFTVILMSTLFYSAAAFSSETSELRTVPPYVQKFVRKGGVVIAFAETAASESTQTIAMAVRAPAPGQPLNADAWETKYTCDLLLLRKQDGDVTLTGQTDRAVSCSTSSNLGATTRMMDDSLQLSRNEVTFENVQDTAAKGMFSYTFRFTNDKWHLSAGKSFYSSRNSAGIPVDVEESISYPKDFGLILMENFEPGTIRTAMSKSKKVYEE